VVKKRRGLAISKECDNGQSLGKQGITTQTQEGVNSRGDSKRWRENYARSQKTKVLGGIRESCQHQQETNLCGAEYKVDFLLIGQRTQSDAEEREILRLLLMKIHRTTDTPS